MDLPCPEDATLLLSSPHLWLLQTFPPFFLQTSPSLAGRGGGGGRGGGIDVPFVMSTPETLILCTWTSLEFLR